MKETSNTFENENIEYLQKLIGKQNVQIFQQVNTGKGIFPDKDYDIAETVGTYLSAMKKSANNRWWLSEDKRVIAYYQLFEPIPLVPFKLFHESIELLLGRTVWKHEFSLNLDGLKDEAEKAFKGTATTDKLHKNNSRG